MAMTAPGPAAPIAPTEQKVGPVRLQWWKFGRTENSPLTRRPFKKWWRETGWRHLVGAAPAVGRVDFGLELEAARVQLAIETFDVRLHRRPLDLQAQVADAAVEEFVANRLPAVDQAPGTCGRHR